MAQKDYYQVLGIEKSASLADIKSAFKKLARKYHPDVNPNDKAAEEKFKEISEAYEVLGDDKKRKQYDQFGRFDFGGSGPQDPFSQNFWQSGGFNQVDLEDIFGDILGGFKGSKRGNKSGQRVHFDFGGGPSFGSSPPRSGTDIQWKLPVEFLEAVLGAEKQILLSDGKKIKVKIPAGVETGSKIRVSGKGNPGVSGGAHGDLIIEIEVREHIFFKRIGDDIHVTLNLSLLEALKGASINVPTIHGPVTLKIPAKAQGGQKMRLKDKGVTNLKTKALGHQFVHLNLVLPTDLSESEMQKLEEIFSKHPEVIRNW